MVLFSFEKQVNIYMCSYSQISKYISLHSRDMYQKHPCGKASQISKKVGIQKIMDAVTYIEHGRIKPLWTLSIFSRDREQICMTSEAEPLRL